MKVKDLLSLNCCGPIADGEYEISDGATAKNNIGIVYMQKNGKIINIYPKNFKRNQSNEIKK
jgi:hypothetical protein